MDFSIKGNIIIQTKNEISELLGKHKFDLKGWYSNKLGQWWMIIKVLGLNWNARKDELSVNASQLHSNKAFTKRIVLSIIAGRWDPLGILIGFIISGRLIFQSFDFDLKRIRINQLWT